MSRGCPRPCRPKSGESGTRSWGEVLPSVVPRAPRRRARVQVLLRVELDDELLLHRGGDLRAPGEAEDLRGEAVVVRLQPRRHGGCELGRVAHNRLHRSTRLHRDHVIWTQLVRGDVHAAAIYEPVPVEDRLAGLATRRREPEPHEHVVEARLEQPEQVLTGHAGLAARLLVVVAELLLQHAVVAARLLLLAQLQAVFGLARATAPVVAGRIRAPLDAALVG